MRPASGTPWRSAQLFRTGGHGANRQRLHCSCKHSQIVLPRGRAVGPACCIVFCVHFSLHVRLCCSTLSSRHYRHRLHACMYGTISVPYLSFRDWSIPLVWLLIASCTSAGLVASASPCTLREVAMLWADRTGGRWVRGGAILLSAFAPPHPPPLLLPFLPQPSSLFPPVG